MAITFAAYAAPDAQKPVAVAAVVVLTAVNTQGIQRTAALTRVIVVLVLAGLAVAVVAALVGDDPQADRLTPVTGTGAYGILQAAGLIFFAFAGYARIATLGEEVRDPARTIPKAIPIALGIVLAVYAVVAVTLLTGPRCRRSGRRCRAARRRCPGGQPARAHAGRQGGRSRSRRWACCCP